MVLQATVVVIVLHVAEGFGWFGGESRIALGCEGKMDRYFD